MADILVVDDDQSIVTAFQHFLDFEGHAYRVASNAEDAVGLIAERRPNLVLMDVRMPGVDGLQALQRIRAEFPSVYVVIMTAYGRSQTSIDAIRAGAFDYLTKPLDLDQLRDVIHKALAAQQVSDVAGDTAGPDEVPPAPSLVGETAAMLDVYKMIGRLSTNDEPALVVGERGTGRGLVVATIHDNSARRDRPFVTINCAETPETAIEAALFGQENGTIHFDRVEALPTALQGRLARALGDQRSREGTLLRGRVIASAEDDLSGRVAAGTFSRELHDLLALITLRIPPLRDRRDDIPLLIRYFIQRFNVKLNRDIRRVDEQVTRMLQTHTWPGNVGELERVIKRGCIVARSDVITVHDIDVSLADGGGTDRLRVQSTLESAARAALQDRLVQGSDLGDSPFHHIVDAVETTLVREALFITNGNQVKAADILGVNRATLRKKMPADE